MSAGGGELAAALDGYRARTEREARDLERVRQLAHDGDPWSRTAPLHVTGSAVVVHPDTGRVLLRWHDRMQSWMQVGGHADPGEADPLAVALREAVEETGLTDLAPWPPAQVELVHLTIVPVPPGPSEPAHEHADLRYILATARPEAARPEKPSAPVRWMPLADALATVAEDNLATTLRRVGGFLGLS